MKIAEMIYKVRTDASLSQEQFAQIFGVSRQSVHKWENGTAVPELDKLVKIAQYFDVSLDTLIMNHNNRIVEEMKYNRQIKPRYSNMHDWEFYSSNLLTEYQQSIEEGLDIEQYRDVFQAVSRLPKDETKKKLGDVLFDVVIHAQQKEGYKYIEPSELDSIKSLRKAYPLTGEINSSALEDKIHGAWLGRICGCMLGKTVEGIKTNELVPFLKETDNYPMHRYIYKSDLSDEICAKYSYPLVRRSYADEIEFMPAVNDTNYIVISQIIIEKYGRNFTPKDVAHAWVDLQPKNEYCTAERVAFCNFIKGYEPPESAVYKNPYREWIGAQIRGDYFGYINPGDPETAADMAFRDASISHIKNGIYGEMFVSAMIAAAAVTTDIEDIIRSGLAQIPCTSRLYEAIAGIIDDWKAGVSQGECFAKIHQRFDEHKLHDWCHTISNAMIVAAALLYGSGNYAKSICMAVETGFDTDCNGATVGSVLGMAYGTAGIPEYWSEPMHDTLETFIYGVGNIKISERAKMTMKHLR